MHLLQVPSRADPNIQYHLDVRRENGNKRVCELVMEVAYEGSES